MATKEDNIVPFPGTELREIDFATVHSDGVPLSGSRNAVWLCPAYSGAYEHMLYVKPNLKTRQIVAEILCAQIAIAMGLHCAKPYLVSVPPHHFGMPRGNNFLAFGSQQVGPRSIAKVIRDLDIMFEALQKAKAAEGVGVLDEWTGNSVRHERDMIYDPRGTIWIIDHEAAAPAGVAHDEYMTNWLADRLRDRTDQHKRADLLQAFRKKAAKPRTLKLPNAPPPEIQKIVGAAQQWQDVVKFLALRLTELDRLLSQRIIPEQNYLPLAAATQEQHREHP
ncbi:MAG: hypothetical protein QE265_03195 [Rhodoferax sp.]|nr:hypothetical protein [Rhodoferax sp.]